MKRGGGHGGGCVLSFQGVEGLPDGKPETAKRRKL